MADPIYLPFQSFIAGESGMAMCNCYYNLLKIHNHKYSNLKTARAYLHVSGRIRATRLEESRMPWGGTCSKLNHVGQCQ